MAIKPTQETDWATSAFALKTATDSARWVLGWQTIPDNLPSGVGEAPNLNNQNYWQFAVHQWKEYFEDVLGELLQGAPAWDGTSPREEMLDYLTNVQGSNKTAQVQGGFINLQTTFLYQKTQVLSPSSNRIYTAPSNNAGHNGFCFSIQGSQPIENGTSGTPTGTNAENGCYFPPTNRIIWSPQNNVTQLVSTNCSDGTLVLTTNTALGFEPYRDVTYCPVNEKAYFIPANEVGETNWHFSTDGTDMVSYAHGGSPVTVSPFGFGNGVYSPTDNRIYLSVYEAQNPAVTWNYIDCDDDTLGTLTPPVGLSGDFSEAIYSPTNDRIYYFPGSGASAGATWVYYDIALGIFVPFSHGLPAAFDSFIAGSGTYSPVTNRIYVGSRSVQKQVMYIDCDDGTAREVTGLSDYFDSAALFAQLAYSPTDGRIYSLGGFEATSAILMFLQETGRGADLQWGGFYNG